MDCGIYGNIEHTIKIAQGSMTAWQTKNQSVRGSGVPQISGDTIIVRYDGCYWTVNPNAEGKTAPTTVTCSGFTGIGAGSWSSVFRRTSR
jgi:hypothetical protein